MLVVALALHSRLLYVLYIAASQRVLYRQAEQYKLFYNVVSSKSSWTSKFVRFIYKGWLRQRPRSLQITKICVVMLFDWIIFFINPAEFLSTVQIIT